MSRIYGDARVVVNEGGARHYPITMRIFEAVGSGAALLTDPVPGLELLFDPNADYAVMTEDVVEDVERLITDLDATDAMTTNAYSKAERRHTYDHRVDQLVEIARDTRKREIPDASTSSDLARLIDDDVEVQRIVHDLDDDLAAQLPNREVWPLAERAGRLAAGSMDAAVITRDSGDDSSLMLESARRYIYARGALPSLDSFLEARHPNAPVLHRGDVRRIDLLAESYRTEPAGKSP
jgi:hypothetical protein